MKRLKEFQLWNSLPWFSFLYFISFALFTLALFLHALLQLLSRLILALFRLAGPIFTKCFAFWIQKVLFERHVSVHFLWRLTSPIAARLVAFNERGTIERIPSTSTVSNPSTIVITGSAATYIIPSSKLICISLILYLKQ